MLFGFLTQDDIKSLEDGVKSLQQQLDARDSNIKDLVARVTALENKLSAVDSALAKSAAYSNSQHHSSHTTHTKKAGYLG